MLNSNISKFVCGFVILFFCPFIYHGCAEKKEDSSKIKAVPVITGEASTRRVIYTINQVGTLEASQEVTIRSEIEGSIIELLFKEGGGVKKGDVLVRLDSAKIQAEMRNLNARIDQLKVRLANRQRTLKRKSPLVTQDLISRLDFDNLQTEIKEIKAEIAQIKAALSLEKERLSDTIIRSPFDGVAGARNISTGDYLKVGESVVTVVNLNPLEIAFNIPEKFSPDIFINQEVILKLSPFPAQIFKGTIFFISPLIDIKTRNFMVKAKLDNTRNLLKPGMFAHVEIVTEVHENALTVPWESVIRTESETYVYIVKGETARKVTIHPGKVTNEWAEVLDADIPSGTQVILEGKYAVKDGMKVSIKKIQKTGKENKTND
ncbi:MAG: efflux RND transporter periplasmic adaptor subunit [Thermodesulfobacteriota bacterium]|nr:efflux RND transporter periplasmic adaptor subunit [Thermodesulfobacteriota bacterium]